MPSRETRVIHRAYSVSISLEEGRRDRTVVPGREGDSGMPSFSFVDEKTSESFVTNDPVPNLVGSVQLPRVQRGKCCTRLYVSDIRPTTIYTVVPCQKYELQGWPGFRSHCTIRTYLRR